MFYILIFLKRDMFIETNYVQFFSVRSTSKDFNWDIEYTIFLVFLQLLTLIWKWCNFHSWEYKTRINTSRLCDWTNGCLWYQFHRPQIPIRNKKVNYIKTSIKKTKPHEFDWIYSNHEKISTQKWRYCMFCNFCHVQLH